MTEKEKQEIVKEVTDKVALSQKPVLTSLEASRYLGISLSRLYKLTCAREIPHYKPTGKMCYFNRREVEQWLQTNRVATDEELEQQAQKLNRKEAKK